MVSKKKRQPDNEERPYKLSDVKRCFPLASDPLIGRWIEKGYISHGTRARGSLKLYTFSLSEIVHIGVLMQASAFGITQSVSRIEVMLVMPPSDSPLSKNAYETDFLKPKVLIDLYEAIDYDIAYVFRSRETNIKQEHGRNKKGSREYFGSLAIPWMIAGMISREFAKQDSQLMQMGGTLLIHVGAIADLVGTTLGLGQLWKSRDITV